MQNETQTQTQKRNPPTPKKPLLCKGNICSINKDLTGQVIIITGSSTGIGKETARVLAYMNPTIIMACRNEQKTRPVIEEIQKESLNDKIIFMRLDLGDLKSIKSFADEFKSKYQTLNVLINNAGLNHPERQVTADGFEAVFGTNHLGHFYLTDLLVDVLKKSAPSRIINVSSDLHERAKINWDDLMSERNYGVLSIYSQSKLANVIFTKELQRKYGKDGVISVSLHPGVIRTELNRDLAEKWWGKAFLGLFSVFQGTALEGAQTTLYCTLEDHEKLQGGAYYRESRVRPENKIARKEENWTKLWNLSEQFIAEKIHK